MTLSLQRFSDPIWIGARVRAAARAALAGLLLAAGSAAPASAADPSPSGEGDKLSRDLFSVLALRGKPCGRVLEAQKQAEQDYLVRCEDGNRYRIHIDGERVVIESR